MIDHEVDTNKYINLSLFKNINDVLLVQRIFASKYTVN